LSLRICSWRKTIQRIQDFRKVKTAQQPISLRDRITLSKDYRGDPVPGAE
jgi:hypothetical protein